MTSLSDWYKNPNNAPELAQILDNPVLQKALDVITSANSPIFRAGVKLDDLAVLHSFQAGVHHVRRTLQVLATPQPQQTTQMPPEWEGDHIIPPADTPQ